eukprot:gb/GFBE01044324.1/.p1 GENE.gb/GFBE01044324.1/~~gb/GFBE01044324.1/.p1  ORF type:complete len:470 (+),score=71.99 gb/GFBE01044324.1/:1-1410(+)
MTVINGCVSKVQIHKVTLPMPTAVSGAVIAATARAAVSSTTVAPPRVQPTPPASPSRVFRAAQSVSVSPRGVTAAAIAGALGSLPAEGGVGRPHMSAAAPGSKQKPSVLAFGDSLTLGWTYQNGPTKPYSDPLQQLLALPEGSVVSAGQSGQKASAMAPRLRNELARGCCFDGMNAESAEGVRAAMQNYLQGARQRRTSCSNFAPSQDGRPWDIVVILAGTNDLRMSSQPEAVLQELLALHSIVRAAGASCVAVTVPQCGPDDAAAGSLTGHRRVVNDGLRAAAAASMQGRGPNLTLADFDMELSRLPKPQRDALFTDTVHFSEEGYKLLASVVQKALLPLLGPSAGAVSQASPVVQPSAVAQIPRPLTPVVTSVSSPVTVLPATKKRPRVASDCSVSSVTSVSSITCTAPSHMTSVAGAYGGADAKVVSAVSSFSQSVLCRAVSASVSKYPLHTARFPITRNTAILVA